MKKSVIFLVFLWLMASVEAAYLDAACTYDRPGSYVTIVYGGDLKGDGINEILVGSDNGDTLDFAYGKCNIRWSPVWVHPQSTSPRGNIVDLRIKDIDADGRNELVVASDSGSEYITVLSNEGGFFKWSDQKGGGIAFSLDVDDVDSDGIDEIIYGNKAGYVVVLEGRNNVKWKTLLDNPVYFIDAVDVNGDGSMEVVALTNSYPETATLFVLENSGKKLWSYSIEGGVYWPGLYRASKNNIVVGDIDSDGRKEIVLATNKQGIIALDSDGSVLWTYGTNNPVTSLYTGDLDGDGEEDLVASSNPYLYLLTPTGEVKPKTDIGEGALIIQFSDLEGDGFNEIIAATKNKILVFRPNGAKKGEWLIGKDIGLISIYVMDLDSDGRKEIIAGFGWEEARLDSKVKSGRLVILKVGASPIEETTTSPQETTSTQYTTIQSTTTTVVKPKTTTTLSQETSGGGFPFMLVALGAVFFVFILLLVVIVAVILLKKKKDKKGAEEKKETQQ